MAGQRIVLTSPWRLGLFVFLLVVGTGFGLVYAYIELFGWKIDLDNEQTVQYAYAVLGAVAVLGLLGYVAVVSSARPLERVVRGSKAREHAIKRLGKIGDPRDADLDDFEDEPVLVKVVERWAQEIDTASSAQLELASHREAVQAILRSVQEGDAEAGVQLDPAYESPDLQALVSAINDFARSSAQTAGEQAAHDAPAPAAAGPSEWDLVRDQVTQAVAGLGAAEAELEAFVPTVAQRAGQLADAAQRMASTDASGAVSAEVVQAVGAAQQGTQKIGQLREALEVLAEESNKLAITMALQISRLGEQGGEMLETAEGVRSLSTRYQRIAADLRMCEAEQASTLSRLQQMGGHGGAVDSQAAQALVQEAMGLDQNAELLREVLGKLQNPLAVLRSLTGVPAPAKVEVAAAPAPAIESAPVDASPATEERIYEIAELGGQAIEADGDVHELQEFGAVEL